MDQRVKRFPGSTLVPPAYTPRSQPPPPYIPPSSPPHRNLILPFNWTSNSTIQSQKEALKARFQNRDLERLDGNWNLCDDARLKPQPLGTIRYACGHVVEYHLLRNGDSKFLVGRWTEVVYGPRRPSVVISNFLNRVIWPPSEGEETRRKRYRTRERWWTLDFEDARRPESFISCQRLQPY